MEYNVYDNFNSEGMVVYVVYDNGDKKETTDYTIVNDENLTCKVEEIQIQYNTNSEIKTIVSGIKVNHKEEIMEKIEATCTEKGKTEGKYCEICNTVLEKQEEIPELGHSFTKYELNNNSTCTEDGTKTAKCDRCEERNTIIDAGTKLEHTYEKEVIIPTCKRAGHTIYKCTKCNENYTDEYTNALGHNFTNYQSNNDSGCEVDGTKTAKCDRCEEIKTVLDEGTKKVHEYKEGRCIYCGKEDVYSEEKENIFNELIINYARLRKQTLARARFSVADITDDGKVTVADLVKINYFRPNEITGT